MQSAMKLTYDVKTKVQSFGVGDLVYRRNSAHRTGLSKKLCPVFVGPYIVSKVISPFLYRVEDRKRVMVLHHDKLKRCIDRAIPFWVRRRRHHILKDSEKQVATTAPSPGEQQAIPDDVGQGENMLGHVIGTTGLTNPSPFIGMTGPQNPSPSMSIGHPDLDVTVSEGATAQGIGTTGLADPSPFIGMTGPQNPSPSMSIGDPDLDETVPYGEDLVDPLASGNPDLDETMPYGDDVGTDSPAVETPVREVVPESRAETDTGQSAIGSSLDTEEIVRTRSGRVSKRPKGYDDFLMGAW